MHVSALKESKFLKRTDVGSGALVTIRNLTQENVAKEGADPDMKWAIHFDEMDKPLILNSTNAQLIAQILKEEETDGWTGQRIVLYDDPSVSFGGKLVGGIRVRAPKQTAKPGAKPVFKQAEEEDGVPF